MASFKWLIGGWLIVNVVGVTLPSKEKRVLNTTRCIAQKETYAN